MPDCLAYALAYAEVLPGTLLPVRAMEKRPAIAEWQKAACNDASALERWFDDNRANLGWQPDAGYVVLDVDVKADDKGITGFGTLSRLESKYGTLPATLSATTPTGGKHYVFKLPEGAQAKNIVGSKAGAPGLDIRTAGGQIVVQPSERPEGKYQWDCWNPLDGTRPHIAEAPAWVVQFACGTLDAKSKKSAPKAAKATGGMVVREGSRNGALVSEAGRLRRVGYEYDAMFAALQALNESQFVPPVPVEEVRAIAKWICEKHFPSEWATLAEQHSLDEWYADLDAATSIAERLEIARRINQAGGLAKSERAALIKVAAKQAGVPLRVFSADLHAEPDDENPRPMIRVRKNDFAAAVDDCSRVLTAIPCLRQRGGALVEIVADEGGTKMQPVSIARLAYLTAQAARWNYGDGGDGSPSPDVLQAVMSAGAWPGVAKVVGLLHQPTIDPTTGEIISGRGYAHALQREAIFDPACFSPYAGNDALDQLRALLTGFPFATARDEAAALAAVLTAAIRPILPTAPAFMVTASDYGSGKTYLSRIIAAFSGVTGVQRWPGRQEEASKALLSLLLEGRPAVIFDNLAADWRSDTMAAILTDPVFSDRQLGVSKSPEVSTACLFVANGVNVGPAADLQRRVITINLDARCERPWEREFDRDPLAEIEADRGRWLMIALHLLSDYLREGAPVRLSSLGSFSEWSRIVRGAIVAAGLPDPVQALGANVEDDEDRDNLARFLYCWRNSSYFGDVVTVRDLVRQVQSAGGDTMEAGLRYVLEDIGKERGEISTRRVGLWFRSNRGRVIDGLRLVNVGTRGEYGAQWTVEHVGRAAR